MAHDARCIPYTGQHYAWPDDVQTVRYTLERVRANVTWIRARRANVEWKDSLTTFMRQGERIAAGLRSLQIAFSIGQPPQHRAVCAQVCRASAWLERLTLRVSSPLIQHSSQSPFTGNRATTNPRFNETACQDIK